MVRIARHITAILFAFCCVTPLFSLPVFAAPIASLSASPNLLDEGETAELELTFQGAFLSWSATFTSGEGETTLLTSASGDNSVVFTFDDPGTFVATVSGLVNFPEQFFEFVPIFDSEGNFIGFREEIRTRVVTGSFSANTPITVAQIPEPATLALVSIVLAGLGFSRRKLIVR